MKKNLIQIIISAILFVIGLLVPFSNGWITKGICIFNSRIRNCYKSSKKYI